MCTLGRIEYKYIGICYGLPGVGKTLSSRYYSDWDFIDSQINYSLPKLLDRKINPQILTKKTLFYTAPAVKATKMTEKLFSIDMHLSTTKSICEFQQSKDNEYKYPLTKSFEDIDLLIVDEIDRLKLQSLEQIRALYDQHNFAIVLIGMPGIEKKLARYPQLYSRIGFAHEFDKLSKDETHHILEHKWEELGLSITIEDFSDYEAITSIIKITNGNFRLIQRLFSQIERILKINNLTIITTEVVEAARDSLVIGIK